MAGKQKRKKQKEPPVPALLPNPLGTEMPNYITYHMTWAETLLAAVKDAYAAADHIHFEGMHKRSDIGARALHAAQGGN